MKGKEELLAIKINKGKMRSLKWMAIFIVVSTLLVLYFGSRMTTYIPFYYPPNAPELIFFINCLAFAQMICSGLVFAIGLRLTLGAILDMMAVMDKKNPLFNMISRAPEDRREASERGERDSRFEVASVLALVMSTKRGCKMLERTGPYVNCCLIATIVFNLMKANGLIGSFWLAVVTLALMYLRHQLHYRYQEAVQYSEAPSVLKTLESVVDRALDDKQKEDVSQ